MTEFSAMKEGLEQTRSLLGKFVSGEETDTSKLVAASETLEDVQDGVAFWERRMGKLDKAEDAAQEATRTAERATQVLSETVRALREKDYLVNTYLKPMLKHVCQGCLADAQQGKLASECMSCGLTAAPTEKKRIASTGS